MATAFSPSKFAAQPSPLNTTSQNNPLTIPTTASPFLGSTRKLIRLSSSSNLNLRRGSETVVKENKSKSTPNLLITKEEGLELYEDMVLGRAVGTAFDKCAQMYYDRKMFGLVDLYNGQEAVSTGFIKLLKQQDSIVYAYPDHVQALSKGVPARAILSELLRKATGC
ncbi:hypothetical protein ES288_D12G228000v1 [Gossypium darwinii]|nr:hypothetical protein ES288_D12G228000v1 [Gossypium darwinii]